MISKIVYIHRFLFVVIVFKNCVYIYHTDHHMAIFTVKFDFTSV